MWTCQKKNDTSLSKSKLWPFQNECSARLFARTHSSKPVKNPHMFHEGRCVEAALPHMRLVPACFLRCVSGKGLSDMMADVMLIIHTHTHSESWQVKAVSYLENREVIQTNCTCF